MLYTTSLKANIVSLGRLDEEGYDFRLHKGSLTIHDDRGFLLTKVQRSSGRLYPLKLDIIEHCLQISEDCTWLWHKRYEHLNLASIKILSSQNLVKGLPTIHKREELCSCCFTSRQARKLFPSSAKFRASRPLERIHGDLCGPFALETLGGSKYFLLLVDDCTRMLWVSLLKQKLEAFKAFKSFKVQAKREKELKLICLRTDNGGEFTSKEFISFCSEHGIQRHFSTSYTPQQNGVVEIKNHSILDMTHAMLKNKTLPKVYLLNRAPTKSLEGKTPNKGWTGRQPSREHLKVFGCIVFVKTLGKSLRKLDDRSIPMIFIGYEKGVKGYRTFNPVSEEIHITKDALFKEEKSWNWEEFNQDSPTGMLTSEYSSYVNVDSNNSEMPTVSSSEDSITENSCNFSICPMSSSSSTSSQPSKNC